MMNILNYIIEFCISFYENNLILCNYEESSRKIELEENLLKFCDNSDEEMSNYNKIYPIFENTIL